MNIDKNAVKAFLSQLSPLQLSELVNELRCDWRLPEEVAPNPVPDPRPPDPQPPPQTDVVVTDVGPSRVAVIRALRATRPALDLRGARDLLQAAPGTLFAGLVPSEADRVAEALRRAGARVDLRPGE